MHAVRNLSRIAFGRARLRWSQLGFGRTSKTTAAQATPRNLFGYKDGTANILADDGRGARRTTCGSPHPISPPGWRAARTSSPARSPSSSSRGTACGSPSRTASSAAPRARGHRFRAATSSPRRTSRRRMPPARRPSTWRRTCGWRTPRTTPGRALLRRGYNFVDGNNELGRLDAGLFFLSYQRSPEQFVTVQRALATRRAERVHSPRRVGGVRRAAGRGPRVVRRRRALRLTAAREAGSATKEGATSEGGGRWLSSYPSTLAAQVRSAERPLLEAGEPLMQRAAAALARIALDRTGRRGWPRARARRQRRQRRRRSLRRRAPRGGPRASRWMCSVTSERVHEAALRRGGRRRGRARSSLRDAVAAASEYDLVLDGILGIGASSSAPCAAPPARWSRRSCPPCATAGRG